MSLAAGGAIIWLTVALGSGGGVPLIGDPAPAFDLPALDGGGRITGERLRGQVTVVDFFAPWCAPCVRSQEDLRALRAELGPGLQVLIIAVESEAAAVRAHFAAHPAPEGALIAHDVSADSAKRWGRDRLPTAFFVDAEGVVRHINRGHGAGFRARARRWLAGMLAARG